MNTDAPVKPMLLNILIQGYLLARRHWPLILCAYAINLAFGLLAAVPFSHGLASILDHSLAAQKIAGTIDLGSLAELSLHLHEAHFFPMVAETALWLNLLELLLLFVLFAHAIFAYVSAEAPQSSILPRAGIADYWRFVRASVLAGCVCGVILGVLLAARAALLSRLADVYFEEPLFVWTAISGAVVFVAALLLRLWFDLVEVYVVRHAVSGELRARRSLLPAARLLFRYFFRMFGSFCLVGLGGVCALALCLWLWKALPANQVWVASLLSQAGLFLLLASRFWQRGLEAAFVLAVDPPVVVTSQVVEPVEEEEEIRSLPPVAVLTTLSEPTLSELVQKLRTEPWSPPPEPMFTPESKGDLLVDHHATKFPLGGVEPPKEAASATGEDPPQPDKPQS